MRSIWTSALRSRVRTMAAALIAAMASVVTAAAQVTRAPSVRRTSMSARKLRLV